MHGIDVKCPECGAINYSLDLVETDGWMECERCGCTARLVSLRRGDATELKNCRWQLIRPLPGSGPLHALRNHG